MLKLKHYKLKYKLNIVTVDYKKPSHQHKTHFTALLTKVIHNSFLNQLGLHIQDTGAVTVNQRDIKS